jgi:hypothetical protein
MRRKGIGFLALAGKMALQNQVSKAETRRCYSLFRIFIIPHASGGKRPHTDGSSGFAVKNSRPGGMCERLRRPHIPQVWVPATPIPREPYRRNLSPGKSLLLWTRASPCFSGQGLILARDIATRFNPCLRCDIPLVLQDTHPTIPRCIPILGEGFLSSVGAGR